MSFTGRILFTTGQIGSSTATVRGVSSATISAGTAPSDDACTEKMRRLVKLHGIGAEFATVLTREVFYRPFQNRRQVASYVGLTSPYDSGDTKHDQGRIHFIVRIV